MHPKTIDWVTGNATEAEAVEVMQALIDSGDAWRLEGAVGRSAMSAIDAGACVLGPEGHRDYWGNYVPSRYEVKPGTTGSPAYGHRLAHGNRPHRELGRFVACPFA